MERYGSLIPIRARRSQSRFTSRRALQSADSSRPLACSLHARVRARARMFEMRTEVRAHARVRMPPPVRVYAESQDIKLRANADSRSNESKANRRRGPCERTRCGDCNEEEEMLSTLHRLVTQCSCRGCRRIIYPGIYVTQQPSGVTHDKEEGHQGGTYSCSY
jgi:hypothetical protein